MILRNFSICTYTVYLSDHFFKNGTITKQKQRETCSVIICLITRVFDNVTNVVFYVMYTTYKYRSKPIFCYITDAFHIIVIITYSSLHTSNITDSYL